jgi:hypothetical protein
VTNLAVAAEFEPSPAHQHLSADANAVAQDQFVGPNPGSRREAEGLLVVGGANLHAPSDLQSPDINHDIWSHHELVEGTRGLARV